MDKRNSSNIINRNTSSIFNHMKSRVVRSNLVAPDIFVSEIWMQDDTKNGVEIIELSSSNSEVEETSQELPNTFSQAWSVMNNDRFRDAEEDYKINKIAREKRRTKNEEEFSVAYTKYLHDHDTQVNFNGFNYVDDSEISGIPHGEQINCFTIINNHVINSGSSSENEYARVEEIEPFFTESTNDSRYWDHVYKDDAIAYDPINAEKRTVWIYSFKNKRRLYENDFELVNIPSIDSTNTTTSPLSDEECKSNKSTNVCRIASPIPASFIPRLDLSLAQTLSTVTELSEIKNSDESLIVKPINNWLTDRNTQKSKYDASNVVNWMALSPRERRRRFKNTYSESNHESHDIKYAEGNIESGRLRENPRKPSVFQVDVEVHATNAPDIFPATDVDILSIESFDLESKGLKKTDVDTPSIDITYTADANNEIDDENGDCNFDQSSKPSIKLSSNKTYTITEPLEKLKDCQWIVEEENIEELTADFDYVLNADEYDENESIRSADAGDPVSQRLWMKHAKLMKSPLWTEYLPITESQPSLHLSLSLSSIEGKSSWLKRIANYFKCCK